MSDPAKAFIIQHPHIPRQRLTIPVTRHKQHMVTVKRRRSRTIDARYADPHHHKTIFFKSSTPWCALHKAHTGQIFFYTVTIIVTGFLPDADLPAILSDQGGALPANASILRKTISPAANNKDNTPKDKSSFCQGCNVLKSSWENK